MKKASGIFCVVLLIAGCGEAPPPTGPAAEAPTPDIEVSIPDSTDTPATPPSDAAAQPSPNESSQVTFHVPGMS